MKNVQKKQTKKYCLTKELLLKLDCNIKKKIFYKEIKQFCKR